MRHLFGLQDLEILNENPSFNSFSKPTKKTALRELWKVILTKAPTRERNKNLFISSSSVMSVMMNATNIPNNNSFTHNNAGFQIEILY